MFITTPRAQSLQQHQGLNAWLIAHYNARTTYALVQARKRSNNYSISPAFQHNDFASIID